ncbi:hypothetical protein SteCoe_18757 [Stentor coeruleus]|uniref:Uncharacterized protein n=1 Tax=Stentor coeruleus TaxID=5963 RepID=A0A1R2BVQ3_9CILI|nr:hypothetical protein SteCoe_18757 [Stentor coeruleus]
MQEKDLHGLIEDLETTQQKVDFLDRLDTFNKTFIDKHKNKSDEEEKGTFPFGSVMPKEFVTLQHKNGEPIACPVIQTIYYVPYFPPRTKEVYPYHVEAPDLQYWREKRLQYNKYLDNF